MTIDLYNTIKGILESIPTIFGVQLYNGNDPDKLMIYPFAEIEFQSIQYEDMSNKQQMCRDAQVVIHIIHKNLITDDTRMFGVSQDVYKAMFLSGYKRRAESINNDGSEITDWQIVFDCPMFIDDSVKDELTSITKPPLQITLEIPN